MDLLAKSETQQASLTSGGGGGVLGSAFLKSFEVAIKDVHSFILCKNDHLWKVF